MNCDFELVKFRFIIFTLQVSEKGAGWIFFDTSWISKSFPSDDDMLF